MIIAEHTYFNATTFSFAFNELNIKLPIFTAFSATILKKLRIRFAMI